MFWALSHFSGIFFSFLRKIKNILLNSWNNVDDGLGQKSRTRALRILRPGSFSHRHLPTMLITLMNMRVRAKTDSSLNNLSKNDHMMLNCYFSCPHLRALRGHTVHSTDAEFCVCIFLDSRDQYLNMLKFCRNDQRK